jgi:hypothetical protein
MGAIDSAQAQNIAADEGLIPKEFILDDQTSGGSLEDDEKPMEDAPDLATEPVEEALPATKAYAGLAPWIDSKHPEYVNAPVPAVKAAPRATIESEWAAALKWAEEAQDA